MWIYIPLFLIGAILCCLAIGKTDTNASDAFKIVNGYSVASIVCFLVGLHFASVRRLVFDKSLGQLEMRSKFLVFGSSQWVDLKPMKQVTTLYRGNSDTAHYAVVLQGALEECPLVESLDAKEINDFAQQVAQFLGLEIVAWESVLYQQKDEGGALLQPGLRIIDQLDGRSCRESTIDSYGRLVFQRRFGTNLRWLGSFFLFFVSLSFLLVVVGGIQVNLPDTPTVFLLLVFWALGFVLSCGWKKIFFDKTKQEVLLCWGALLPLVRFRRATGVVSDVLLEWKPVASLGFSYLQGAIVLRGDNGQLFSMSESPRGDEQRSIAARIAEYLGCPMVEGNRVAV